MRKFFILAFIIAFVALGILGFWFFSKPHIEPPIARVFEMTNVQLAAENAVTNNSNKTNFHAIPENNSSISNSEANTNLAQAVNSILANPFIKPLKYKIITDPQSGQYATVDSKREVVTLMDRDNHVIVSTNLVQAMEWKPIEMIVPPNLAKATGLKPVAGASKREIVSMELYKNTLVISVDGNIFTIDKNTGAVTYCGSN